MSKKILSLILVAVMLFSFAGIAVSAEDEPTPPAPEYSLEKTVSIAVMNNYVLTEGALANFGVEVKLNTKNIVALDGATTEHSCYITDIKASRDGVTVSYDEENPDEFLDLFRFAEDEERVTVNIDTTFKVDFVHAEVFGDLGYEVVINGFSAPPDLGISLGDMVAIPTAITYSNTFEEFPELKPGSLKVLNASIKQFYSDAEKPELDGTSLELTIADIRYSNDGAVVSETDLFTGTVTYAPANAHMFTTIPEKSANVPFGTKEIVTSFFGNQFSVIPVNVIHAWSTGPVCITTDKYTDTKPGYHAIVCNGCGEAHSAEQHKVDPDSWVSNEDATFVANGTASTVCLDCGATLTKDVHNTAGFNTAFANYHFLLVIFEYINLILRIISAAFG